MLCDMPPHVRHQGLAEATADLIHRRPIRTAMTEPLATLLVEHNIAGRALPLADAGAHPGAGAVATGLRLAADSEAFHSMRVASTTASLSIAVQRADICALFYKGAALSSQLGENIGERPAVDVDLLVARESVESVGTILESQSFRHEVRHPGVPFGIEARIECERTYRGPGPSADLHWAVDATRSFREPFAELWARRVPVMVAGTPVWTLDPVDALLVTCVHGNREQWRQWKWLVDAGRQVGALDPLALTSARHRARSTGCERALATTLAMLEQLGAVDLPPSARPGPLAHALAREALDRSARPTALPEGPAAGMQRRAWRWRTADSPAEALTGLVSAVGRQASKSRPGR